MSSQPSSTTSSPALTFVTPRTSMESSSAKSFKSTSTSDNPLIPTSLPLRQKKPPSKTRKMWESLKRKTSFPSNKSATSSPSSSPPMPQTQWGVGIGGGMAMGVGAPKRVLTFQRKRSRKFGAIDREMNGAAGGYVN